MTTPFASLSSSLSSRLLAGVGTLTLLAAIGLFASRPAHTAGGPIPVTVANPSLDVSDADAARQAVSSGILLLGPIFSSPTGTLYTVPANKRLVIETVSASDNRFDTNSYTIEMDTPQNGALRQTFFNLLPNGTPYSAFSQNLRLYADPGTKVIIISDDNGQRAPFVGFSFSGHLVDL